MIYRALGLSLAAVILPASAAQAVLVPDHIYEFSGDTNDGRGGPAMAAGAGATYKNPGSADGGMLFQANKGPKVSNAFASTKSYSVEMFFSFDTMGLWRRVIDFKNAHDDNGLYFYQGDLNLFGANASANTNVVAGAMMHLAITLTEDRKFVAYLNGNRVFGTTDRFRIGELDHGNIMSFFNDEKNVNETSSGFVDFIRLYDRVLTPEEIAALYNGGAPIRTFDVPAPVPEPSSWALLICGMFATGAALRRSRPRQVQFA